MSETSGTGYTMERLKTNLNAFGTRVKTSSAAAGKTIGEQMTVVSGKMKELFYTPTPADKVVDEATAEDLDGPDWGKIMDICDGVNTHRLVSGNVVRAVNRRLLVKNSHVQLLSLLLLEAAAKNCDRIFSEIASEKVLDEMVKLVDDPLGAPEVRDKCLKLIEAWGEAVDELRFLPVFEETYKSLKSRGVRFPGRDNESLAPIFTPPAMHLVTRQPPPPEAAEPRSALPMEDPKQEIGVARNTVELLSTVLTSAPAEEALQDELTPTLVGQCRQSQSILQIIIETAGEDETLLFEALSVHDEVTAVLAKYESMRKGGATEGTPREAAASEGPAPLVAVPASEEEEELPAGDEEGLVRKRAAARPATATGSDASDAKAMADLDAMIFGKDSGSSTGRKDKKDDDDMIVF